MCARRGVVLDAVFAVGRGHRQLCLKAGGLPAIGDGLSFGVSAFAIKDGMIHRDSIVVAQITDRKPRWFADDIIIVRNLDTGTTGAYHEKGCR